MVYAATRTKLDVVGGHSDMFLRRQALWVGLGLATMVAVMAVDYRVLRDAVPVLYIGTAVGLLGVLSPLGSSARGAQRWFNLGPLQLQPSALAALALIVAVAATCQRVRPPAAGRPVLATLGLAAPLMGLVAVQPDLGSALVLGSVTLIMLVGAGARGQHLAALVLAGGLGVVGVAHLGLLRPYQRARLTAFLDQTNDQGQANYNLAQSKIAISSGGLVGTGLFQGTQTNLSFVPEQQTDFIFTAVGEQLGFAGAASLLGLYGVLAWRTLWVARHAKDNFGRLVCVGVLALVVTQVFENAGMTMGIMPITGIPLPLVSYGGSSTIATFAALGLVNNVCMRRFT